MYGACETLTSRDGYTYTWKQGALLFPWFPLVVPCAAAHFTRKSHELGESSSFFFFSLSIFLSVSLFFSTNRTVHYRAAKDSRTLLAILQSRLAFRDQKNDGRRVYHDAFMPSIPPQLCNIRRFGKLSSSWLEPRENRSLSWKEEWRFHVYIFFPHVGNIHPKKSKSSKSRLAFAKCCARYEILFIKNFTRAFL